jgi:mono/diheme cytochrome c family protein
MKFKSGLLAIIATVAASAAVAQPRPAGPAAAVTPQGRAPFPEMVQRGEAIYGQTCTLCHGAAGHGGPGGAPDLTTSAIAMADDGGQGLAAFLAVGRPDRGMPARPVTEEEAAGLSAKLRSFAFPQAGASAPAPARVLVGDAATGKAFFNGPVGRCSTCHAVTPGTASAASNLAAVAAKYPDPKALQNAMILPDRRFYWSPANSKDINATVTYRDGRTVKGFLSSVSDFKVIIRDDAGKETILERSGGEPKVTLQDRLQHHLDLLRIYKDNTIHDVTAYLATLK